MRVGSQRCPHRAIHAVVTSHSVWIGVTAVEQQIAQRLRPSAETLDLQDEAFPTAVETYPHNSSRGAKADHDGPGQIANPDIAEAEVTEKGELLSCLADEFVFEDFGPRAAVTHPGGRKRPDDENHSDRDADNQREEALSGHRNVNAHSG